MHVVTKPGARSIATLLLLGWGSATADEPTPPAPAQGTPAFRGETRVAVVDVMLEATRSKRGDRRPGEAAPERLDAKEIIVRLDGPEASVDARVVAVEAHEPEADRPWTVVVWIDRALSDGPDRLWAAERLAAEAKALTAIGTVEVLLAGDGVRQLVAPTRDAATLDGALSRFALEDPSDDGVALDGIADDRLRALREEYGELAATQPTEADALAAIAAQLERRTVESRHDLLLEALLARGCETPRKAVIWITGGWDAEPERYYRASDRALAQGTSDETAATEESANVGAEPTADPATAILGRVLAAYGWIVLPLMRPAPLPPPPGFYLGKWFFYKPTWNPRKGQPIPWLPGLAAVRKKYLDPERARNYHHLGLALRDQGKLDQAVEAFEKALFHFQEDPRTGGEQAVSWRELGATLRRADRHDEARRALARAATLDPSLDPNELPAARLLEPYAPLAALASVTGGRLLDDEEVLGTAIPELAARLRMTFELSGPPAGELIATAIEHRGGWTLRTPAWTRLSTPPEVAALRARRLLADAVEPEDLGAGLDLIVRLDAGAGALRIEVTAPRLPASDTARYLRPTLAHTAGDDTQPVTIHHHDAIRLEADATSWSWSAPLAPTAGDDPGALAIVVDELDTGTWGATIVDLPPSGY